MVPHSETNISFKQSWGSDFIWTVVRSVPGCSSATDVLFNTPSCCFLQQLFPNMVPNVPLRQGSSFLCCLLVPVGDVAVKVHQISFSRSSTVAGRALGWGPLRTGSITGQRAEMLTVGSAFPQPRCFRDLFPLTKECLWLYSLNQGKFKYNDGNI